MGQALLGCLCIKDDFCGKGSEGVPDGHVCQVAPARFGERAVQGGVKPVRLGKFLPKQDGRVGRPHGVGAGWPPSNAIQLPQ